MTLSSLFFPHFFCLFHSRTYTCVHTHIVSSILVDLVVKCWSPCSLFPRVQQQCGGFVSAPQGIMSCTAGCATMHMYTNTKYTRWEEVSLLIYSGFSRKVKEENRESTHETGLTYSFSVQWPDFSLMKALSPSMSLRAPRQMLLHQSHIIQFPRHPPITHTLRLKHYTHTYTQIHTQIIPSSNSLLYLATGHLCLHLSLLPHSLPFSSFQTPSNKPHYNASSFLFFGMGTNHLHY